MTYDTAHGLALVAAAGWVPVDQVTEEWKADERHVWLIIKGRKAPILGFYSESEWLAYGRADPVHVTYVAPLLPPAPPDQPDPLAADHKLAIEEIGRLRDAVNCLLLDIWKIVPRAIQDHPEMAKSLDGILALLSGDDHDD